MEVRGKLLVIRVSLCYILKHLEDPGKRDLFIFIAHAWCDIILIFTLHRRTRLTPGSSFHSLRIQMAATRAINMNKSRFSIL